MNRNYTTSDNYIVINDSGNMLVWHYNRFITNQLFISGGYDKEKTKE